MKVFAFSDLHASQKCLKIIEKKVKKSNPDVILCAGDFTVFEQNIEDVMNRLNKLGRVMLIHGNHETAELVRDLCKTRKNLRFCHKKIIPVKQFLLVSHGGGGFNYRDKDFEQFIKENKDKLKSKKLIFMTHAPPYGTKLDFIDYLENYVGCISYTKFIKKYKPILSVSGHIHDTTGQVDFVNKCEVVNPGPKGLLREL